MDENLDKIREDILCYHKTVNPFSYQTLCYNISDPISISGWIRLSIWESMYVKKSVLSKKFLEITSA